MLSMNAMDKYKSMAARFRGFLPVIVDVETGGLNAETDALLEVAAVTVQMDSTGELEVKDTFSAHIQPFEGATFDEKSLELNGIDPFHPLRIAEPENDALASIFQSIRHEVKHAGCKRAILVGHNAFFDLNFINKAIERNNIKRSPFHPFSSFDTVSLSGLLYGQTVLARAIQAADIEWNAKEAHSARYDAEKTAELFCKIVNRLHHLEILGDTPTALLGSI